MGALFLVHQVLVRAPEGFTLGELVDELRADPLIRADLATFENSLLAYGWLDTYRGQYAHDRYTLVRRRCYAVRDGFSPAHPRHASAGDIRGVLSPGSLILRVIPGGRGSGTTVTGAGRDHGEGVRCGMHGDTVEDFLINLDQTVNDQLARSPGWLKNGDTFVRVAADYLVEDGTLEDLEVCYCHGAFRP